VRDDTDKPYWYYVRPDTSSARRGFTLAELLITAAILLALAALLSPLFIRARDFSRRSVCISNLGQILSAIHMYEADWGQVPIWSGYLPTGFLDGKLLPYGVEPRIAICPSDVGPPSGGKGPYWYGPSSYAYLLTDGLLLEYGVTPPYRPVATSPLVLCRNHERAWRMTIIGRYDGSVIVTPLGQVDAVPELEGVGKLYAKP
jgi:prepilin-type N-terminal cleavage/methylation domain-containing protein